MEDALDGLLSFKWDVLLFEQERLCLDLILPLLEAPSILMSCWSRIAIYDSIAALMTSALSPEAASIEQICGSWTPAGGDACLEFCSSKEVPAAILPDVIVLGDGD